MNPWSARVFQPQRGTPLHPTGIVREGRYLLYGWKHGFLCGRAPRLQNALVAVWNHVSCALFGHDTSLLGIVEYPVCPMCCRRVG